MTRARRAVMSYFMRRPDDFVEVQILSALIGEGVRTVEEVCNRMVDEGVLEKRHERDGLGPWFRMIVAGRDDRHEAALK